MSDIPQFGEKIPVGAEYTDRPGAYAVIFNDVGELLIVEVNGRYHLPGGGIDLNEDPREALVREILEETGYEAFIDREIGKANQYIPHASVGPLNKCGSFYSAHVTGGFCGGSEDDHVPKWVPVAEYMDSPSSEYQRWAVLKRLNEM